MDKFFNKKLVLFSLSVCIVLFALNYYQIKDLSAYRLTPMNFSENNNDKLTINESPSGNIFISGRALNVNEEVIQKSDNHTDEFDKSSYKLIGVILSEKGKEALFSGNNRIVKVMVGGSLPSFGVVKSIHGNHVTLENSEGQVYKWELFPTSASSDKLEK